MARGRSNRGAATEADQIVPSELTSSKMRACMSCSIIKSLSQFVEYGCENCEFMNYDGDKERAGACTTNAFTGCFVLLKPKESWVAKWQRVRTFPAGVLDPDDACSL